MNQASARDPTAMRFDTHLLDTLKLKVLKSYANHLTSS